MQIQTYEDLFDDHTNVSVINGYGETVQLSRSVVNRMDLIERITNGRIYVRLIGGARDGTIGIAAFEEVMGKELFKAFMVSKIPMTAHQENILMRWDITKLPKPFDYWSYLYRIRYSFDQFHLVMDDGKKITPPAYNDERSFEVLVGYEGPTVSCFTKLSKAEREAKRKNFTPTFCDALGHLVETGQFVAVNIGGEMTMGTVTEVIHTGKSVRVRGILKDTATLVSDSTKLIVIDGETRTRAMLKKLSK